MLKLNKNSFGAVLILIFVMSMSFGAVGQDLVGVQTGDTFYFEVTENSINPQAYVSYLEPLLESYDINYTEYGMENFDVNTFVDDLTAMDFPSDGDMMVVEVVKAPTKTDYHEMTEDNYEDFGVLNVTVLDETHTVPTGFALGTPIVFTNWTMWEEVVDEVNLYAQNITEVVVALSKTNGDTTFDVKLSVDFPIPSEIKNQFYLTAIKLTVELSYDKSTGVMSSGSLKIFSSVNIQGNTASDTQQMTWELTDAPTSSSNSNISTSPGFEFLALLTGFSVIYTYYSRKRV